MKLVRSASIEPVPLRWLWKGRIPFGAVYMLDGDGGVSKSTLTCTMAAHVSRGLDWPDGSSCPQGRTILCNTEDPVNSVVVPRLIAAGADRDFVDVLLPSEDGNQFSIPENVAPLEKAIAGQDVKLIVFDPMLDYLSMKTSNISEQQVRRAISYLTAFAQRTGVAIILIRHLNKDAKQNTKYRGSGSVAFYALSRAGLLVTSDPSEPGRCLMLPNKANWSATLPGLAYRLEGTIIPSKTSEIETARVTWDGETAVTTGDLQAVMATDEAESDIGDAAQFLRELLVEPQSSLDVFKRGLAEGFSKYTVFRAAKMIGVSKRYEGSGRGEWLWTLEAVKPDGLSG